jgi:integrase/recombinase XerD
MFDQLFRRRAAVRRHLNSPLLQERLEYLQYFANQGYRLSTLRPLASDLLLIQNLLGLATSSEPIGVETVQAAVDQRLWPRLRHSNHIDGQQRRKDLLSCAIHWLRFLKRLRPAPEAPPASQPLKEEFADYLRVQKGLSRETLRTRCGHIEDFLRVVLSQPRIPASAHDRRSG